ncbi:metal/formaldehyde-sensitive transcriptional repressor [Stenotrophomonas sp. BIGb0135]|uniref:metal/formaldehyde-sensitive transcriptional repressor n=1 Tax=Stenotrophomonas sp. BIGb0135 TaxID=2940620 RepID=UPI0021675902|nr:metal/formaldehyde-sensitive transcriptional repressor [Stenotrophomonas sp. BIGb0135]MCS4235447.1 DNA-binding FrmR family transcriptional regulator [Stenotrophomonas sp. BIGb0135]
MSHVQHKRNPLLARVRRMAGQVAALETSLQSTDADCTDVLVQAAAVRGAAHGLLMALLDEHLQEHVVSPTDPAERAAEAQVLVRLLRAYGK